MLLHSYINMVKVLNQGLFFYSLIKMKDIFNKFLSKCRWEKGITKEHQLFKIKKKKKESFIKIEDKIRK